VSQQRRDENKTERGPGQQCEDQDRAIEESEGQEQHWDWCYLANVFSGGMK
jgi:hypothetical protein